MSQRLKLNIMKVIFKETFFCMNMNKISQGIKKEQKSDRKGVADLILAGHDLNNLGRGSLENALWFLYG